MTDMTPLPKRKPCGHKKWVSYDKKNMRWWTNCHLSKCMRENIDARLSASGSLSRKYLIERGVGEVSSW